MRATNSTIELGRIMPGDNLVKCGHYDATRSPGDKGNCLNVSTRVIDDAVTGVSTVSN